MAIRKWLVLQVLKLSGQNVGHYYLRYQREVERGIDPNISDTLLTQLLDHCYRTVPYYQKIMQPLGPDYALDPQAYLQQMPMLTKDIIRSDFERLRSNDLDQRRWYFNTSGGSTGEPVQFIQDYNYIARAGAVKQVFSWLVGRDIGQPEVYLWGSARDILEGKENWRARLMNQLTNTTFFNAYRMTPEKMRQFITFINARRPRLIVAYVEAIYELARFVERDGLQVVPQDGIITSAGTLYPFMRDKIEQVFGCRVYNRYGSREVGDVACERPGIEGLWVAPWGNFIEVVDPHGQRVSDGEEGEILVTSLMNYAMPLIRYKICDYGVLQSASQGERPPVGQILRSVNGRTSEMFRRKNGSLVDPGFFEEILYFKDWVRKFQVIQKDYNQILLQIVPQNASPAQEELAEIESQIRQVMGDECAVQFVFMDDIPTSASGKFRYTICEITPC